MIGTIAITDAGWYDFLRARPDLTEVNFWRPSARRSFLAPEFSPFLFKLRAPHNAICGFAWFARYSKLPIWLAWEIFEQANGVVSRAEMELRLKRIREGMRFSGGPLSDYIGCTVLVRPVFFPRELWIRQPEDWKVRTQTDKKYELTSGEGRRVWDRCLAIARELSTETIRPLLAGAAAPRYGDPVLVTPRLGQKSFRIAVTDAYGRSCATTGEHSLPALDAGHIMPYADGGPHEVSNGLLLRADLHRLFDKGYIAVDDDRRLVVSDRLKSEFSNGHTYYPYHGTALRLPQRVADQPDPEFLRWHRENTFAA